MERNNREVRMVVLLTAEEEEAINKMVDEFMVNPNYDNRSDVVRHILLRECQRFEKVWTSPQ